MTTRTYVGVGLLLAVLSGCATTTSEVERLAEQHDEHVYALWAKPGINAELLTRDCPAGWPPEWTGAGWSASRKEDGTPTAWLKGWGEGISCRDVAGTRDASDSEFWKFNLYFAGRIYAPDPIFGIPMIPVSPKFKSGQSLKVGVVGGRKRCEAIRLRFDAKPAGVAGDETTHMTEPCTGPFYFRRPSTETSTNTEGRQP